MTGPEVAEEETDILAAAGVEAMMHVSESVAPEEGAVVMYVAPARE